MGDSEAGDREQQYDPKIYENYLEDEDDPTTPIGFKYHWISLHVLILSTKLDTLLR